MNRKPILILAFYMLVLSACGQVSKLSIQPVNQGFKPTGPGYFYSLPRTVVKAEVTIQRSITIPGPYAEFSAQFLGIEPVPMEKEVLWSIAGASISAFNESDPDKLFFLATTADLSKIGGFISLGREGLILTPDAFPGDVSSAAPSIRHFPDDSLWFTNLSAKSFYAETTDTLYKTVFQDSMFVKIPVLKKQVQQKTFEEKANEAASLILKIRKKKIELVTGKIASMNQGPALEVALKELDKLEQEYLALFIGRQFSDRQTISAWFIPGLQGQEMTLFRFSAKQGVLAGDSPKGTPVMITLAPEHGPAMNDNAAGDAVNVVYFRIPEKALVQVSWNDRTITSARIPVYQLGQTITLSINPGKK